MEMDKKGWISGCYAAIHLWCQRASPPAVFAWNRIPKSDRVPGKAFSQHLEDIVDGPLCGVEGAFQIAAIQIGGLRSGKMKRAVPN